MEARTPSLLNPARLFLGTPIGFVGGLLALFACFVSWGPSADTFDVPLQVLWDHEATGGVKLGVPLVSVAGGVALLSLFGVEPFVFLRRLGGVALLGGTALFVVYLGREIGWDNLSAGNVDAGPYLASVAGLLVLLAPSGLWPFRRRRSAATAHPAPAADTPRGSAMTP